MSTAIPIKISRNGRLKRHSALLCPPRPVLVSILTMQAQALADSTRLEYRRAMPIICGFIDHNQNDMDRRTQLVGRSVQLFDAFDASKDADN